MVALLVYGFSRGLYSSRQLARSFEEWVDVRAVTGLSRAGFRSIADLVKPNLDQMFAREGATRLT